MINSWKKHGRMPVFSKRQGTLLPSFIRAMRNCLKQQVPLYAQITVNYVRKNGKLVLRSKYDPIKKKEGTGIISLSSLLFFVVILMLS